MSNNGALIAIGLGAVVAAVVLATSKKSSGTTRVSLSPNDIRVRSPGQPINFIRGLEWQPPGNNFAEQVTYCWMNAGTPSIANNCISWMQRNNYAGLPEYIAAAEM